MTQVDAREPDVVPSRNSAGRGPWAVPLRLTLPAILCGQAVLLWVASGRTWFFVDDFFLLRAAVEGGFSFGYFTRGAFEHFSPVLRALELLQQSLFPLNFTAARVIMILLSTACVWVVHALVRLLVTDRALVVALTLLYAGSVFFVRTVLWWTAAAHVLPAVLFTLVALYAYLRRRLDGGRRWAAVALLAVVAAQLAYEKGMLVPVYLTAVELGLLLPSEGFRAWRRRVVAMWPLWAGMSVITAASAVNLVVRHYVPKEEVPGATLLRFLQMAVFEVFIPGVAGLRYPGAVSAPAWVVPVVSALAVGAVIVATLQSRRGAWRAWVFFAFVAVINILPLGMSRIAMFGMDIGRDPRYYNDLAFLFTFAVAAAVSPHFTRPRGQSGFVLTSVAVLAVVSAILTATLSLPAITRENQGAQAAKEYFTNFVHDVRELEPQDPVVFDGTVPENVVPAWLQPYNRMSRALSLAPVEVRFDVVGDPTYIVSDDGSLVPASFRVEGTVPLAAAGEGAGVEAHGLELRPGPDAMCMVAQRDDAQAAFNFERTFSGEERFLRIRHDVGGDAPVEVFAGRAEQFAPVNADQVVLPADQEGVYLEVDPDEVQSVLVRGLPVGEPVCITEFAIGHPVPSG